MGKVVFIDNQEKRNLLKSLLNDMNEKQLAAWAIEISKHGFEIVNIDFEGIPFVIEGYLVNKLWSEGNASLGDIRRVFFQLQKFVLLYNRDCLDQLIVKSAGQAISTPVVSGHAIISSDYAIKAICKFSSNDQKLIDAERDFQIKSAKNILN